MNKAMPIIELLVDLVGFLSKEDLSVKEVVGRIGTTLQGTGGELAPIELQPCIAGISAARLGCYPHSELPYLLELDLAGGAQPAISALKHLFGEGHPSRTGFERKSEVVFYPAPQGGQWKIAVIVELGPTLDDLNEASVSRVAFRRDPVTQPIDAVSE